MPAGSYVLSGRVRVENISGASQELGCRLSTGDESFAVIPSDIADVIVKLEDAVTLAAPATITIVCDHGNVVLVGNNFQGLGIASSAVLTAISVDGVN